MTKIQVLTIYTILLLGTFAFLSCQTKTINSAETPKRPEIIVVEPTPETSKNFEPITIAATGDIMLGSPFPNPERMPPNDGKDLLSPAAQILQSADIAFGNLEAPLADGGISPKCREEKEVEEVQEVAERKENKEKKRSNCFAFRMPTRYANYLKEAGFDVMSVANNHAGDFGAAGRFTTRKTLDALKIKHAGSDSGKNSTAYLDVKGKKIAFVGFAHNNISLNVNNLTAAGRAVRQADKNADIVVVSFHGGAEGINAQRVPNRTEIFFREKRGNLPLFAKTVVDAGADLVLGHGPHVLRGMEIYKDRLIAYSLGNFATYGYFRLENQTAETLVLEVELDNEGRFVKGKINPFILKSWGFLTPDETNSATKTIRRLSLLDFPNSAPKIDADGIITPD